MISKPETIRTFWPSGAIRMEINFLNGLPHGPFRTWYESGGIEKDILYETGRVKGPWKIWCRSGRFVGSFFFDDSHDNMIRFKSDGSIEYISEYLNGKPHGRTIFEGDSEYLDCEIFDIYGRTVSKSEYIKASEFDLMLPLYEGDPLALTIGEKNEVEELNEWKERQKSIANGVEKMREPFCVVPVDEIFADPDTREAKEWLEEITTEIRSLHKRYYTDLSVWIVDKGYAAGARRIWVTNIDRADRYVSARSLLVEIPSRGPERESALDWVIMMINRNMGFPPDDFGQTYFSIGLD